jgi:hypothetical protein
VDIDQVGGGVGGGVGIDPINGRFEGSQIIILLTLLGVTQLAGNAGILVGCR